VLDDPDGICTIAEYENESNARHALEDPGAFLKFVLAYFFALYFAVARLRR
jgi:hypothetical protein